MFVRVALFVGGAVLAGVIGYVAGASVGFGGAALRCSLDHEGAR